MKKIIFLFLIIPYIVAAQYSVKGKFSPTDQFSYAFLYKATPEGAQYIDRAKLDSIGAFSIPLNTNITPGIYKIVYAVPPEENNFDFIYNGKEEVAFEFNFENGVSFTESNENKLWNSYLKSMQMVNQTINNYYAKEGKDKTAFDAIFKTLKDTQKAYEDSSNGMLSDVFIKANKPYIPETYEDLTTYYENVRQTFFNAVDFDNQLLQSSTFIVDRVNNFMFNSVAENNDNFTKNLKYLAKTLSSAKPKIQTTVLEMVWYGFVQRKNDVMANYLSDNYLLDLAKQTNNTSLIQQLNAFRNTAIGATAPDFEVKTSPETIMLSQLKDAKHYLLVFWSSSCGHCLDELPKVKKIVSEKEHIKVIAFGLEDEGSNWSTEIKNYPEFIHTQGLGKWENPMVKTYDIKATPTYFILDANKTIVAKPDEIEDLEVLLKSL